MTAWCLLIHAEASLSLRRVAIKIEKRGLPIVLRDMLKDILSKFWQALPAADGERRRAGRQRPQPRLLLRHRLWQEGH